ncbi:hypothetical protein STCU_07458 [Strigomonas culicis]|uniref:Uncharacterized protein n=1 Tax=Strigomonas culicis TaxID=28005 RepID=S9U4A5_9TRYP|nr:hypothetical protein STCU_07458 [Strigomonas culicis]|eukprot:EPY23783.1 hypothetical protein STCU_07458 [Strigomonas culicis]
MERLQELQRLCAEADKVHGATHPELRWHLPKLQLLRGLLTVPLTGHLVHAQQQLQQATQTVHQFRARRSPLLEGLKPREPEPELGLYLLAEAALGARVFNWDLVAPGEADAAALRRFDEAAQFYAAPFDTAIDADGIADAGQLRDREMEVLAYNSCLTAAGSFLLNAPRPPATNPRDGPVFLPKQVFQMDPILSVGTSSDIIFSQVQDPEPLSVAAGRRRAGEALERALQLNRGLLPEQRHNAPAAATLQAMACLYADTRDYLYATGLFETANKTVAEVYGPTSLEQAHVHKLRYEFLAGVGSEEEAKAASHEVVHLLKRLDQMPC